MRYEYVTSMQLGGLHCDNASVTRWVRGPLCDSDGGLYSVLGQLQDKVVYVVQYGVLSLHVTHPQQVYLTIKLDPEFYTGDENMR